MFIIGFLVPLVWLVGALFSRYHFDRAELKRRRIASGKPLEQVALDIRRTKEAVVAYESGKVVPPTSVVAALCASLGCEPQDLLAPVDDDFEEVAREHRLKSRRAQGLPDEISDPATLDEVAELLRGAGPKISPG